MSYSQPIPLMYLNPVEQDFGAGTGTAWSFKGPSGKQGMLKNVGLQVTETFADDQTTGKVLVGTTADPNYYAQLEIADGTATTDDFNNQDDSNVILVEALPADTQIEVTFVQCVDSGTAAGKGYPYFETFWY